MNTLKFLLLTQFKRSKQSKIAGFTLLELLVAMILAALVITPLLGFMINMLTTDRQEQAKTTSEQELQAATDYIARDLQQAVYIYDAAALNNISNTANPPISGIKDQLPTVTNGVPVLVFWKREPVKQAVPINTTNCATAAQTIKDTNCNDTFVYSLVAYYLIEDPSSTWSNAARIGRFQISDGVRDLGGKYIDNTKSVQPRDPGFALFNLSQNGTLTTKMNQWQGRLNPTNTPPTTEAYTQQVQVLVDYIDQTPATTIGATPANNDDVRRETCPADSNPNDTDPEWTQVPDYSNASVPAALKTYSFYACVYSSKNTARVYLRGNALARIRRDDINYSSQNSSYFPKSRIEVKGVGGLSKG